MPKNEITVSERFDDAGDPDGYRWRIGYETGIVDNAGYRAIEAAVRKAIGPPPPEATDNTGIIGRPRALIDALILLLHKGIRTRHEYTAVMEDRRGSHFDVRLVDPDGETTDHVARITVEMLPFGSTPADNPDSVKLADRVREVLDADGRSVLDNDDADPSTVGQIDKRNRLITEQCNAIANQAEALGENRVHGPHAAAARRILTNAEALVAYLENAR
jgi:hypothetical protein